MVRAACCAVILAGALLVPASLAAQSQSYDIAVDGRSNIYGSGHAIPPEPGGGGAGILPPVAVLPEGEDRVLLFTAVMGLVNCCGATPDTGPDGKPGATETASWDGISGVVHGGAQMFLAGVFLSDAEPVDPSPPRLCFPPLDEFTELWPVLQQTFFVGDGWCDSSAQVFHAPAGSTRLFLGFIDSQGFGSLPGWYDDNTGALSAEFVVQDESTGVESAPWCVSGTWGTIKSLYR
jgi:hypothetical protein